LQRWIFIDLLRRENWIMRNVTRRQITVAGLGSAALLALSHSTRAAECPPNKVRLDGSGQKAGATAPKGVSDSVIASMALVEETEVGVEDRLFRLRRLEIQPGGEVPWHSHADRPAIIYIVQGSITEYRNICQDPLVRKAGDAIAENHLVSQWWKNTGKETAIVLSADLFHVTDPNLHMM
jgi:quercetin dioxygenase-like cupin family protein